MKIAQNYAQASFVSHYLVHQNVLSLLEGTFHVRKMKIKMADRHKHVLSKVVKN